MEINGKKLNELNLEFRGSTMIEYDDLFNRDLLLDFTSSISSKSIHFAFFYRFLYTMLHEKGIVSISFNDWIEEAFLDGEDIKVLAKIIEESPRIQVKKKIKETESR